ncbi:MAG: fasciclin domain-containing protein [Terriglobales bacterium]
MSEKFWLGLLCVGLLGGLAAAQRVDPMVGGAAMYPSRNIIENALHSKDHTTLVAAVKAAGLVSTLESPGPFTVFAPTDQAFAKLPAGALANLLKPENKAMLVKLLTYHVVAARLTTADLRAKISGGGGRAVLTTVEGGKLWVMERRGKFVLQDETGHRATITIANVLQSNGVIQVINAVLMPK